jgi:hypothetical protein
MELKEQIRTLKEVAAKVKRNKNVSEEATKQALIMPFIQALGYNVFDLDEVEPEFGAGVGTKEKVDYAVKRGGQPIMLIECKSCNDDISGCEKSLYAQLYKYFAANTGAKFAVLTNGIRYKFYTDLDKDNILDDKPFFEFDINESTELTEVLKFHNDHFDPEVIIGGAKTRRRINEIKAILDKEFTTGPSPAFVKVLASQMDLSGPVTQSKTKVLADAVRAALEEFIKDKIQEGTPEQKVSKGEPAEDTGGKVNVSGPRSEQLKFWQQLKDYASKKEPGLRLRTPRPQHWFDVAIGRSDCNVALTLYTQGNKVGCELYIPDSKKLYKELFSRKADIEKVLNLSGLLDWQELPGKKASRIRVFSAFRFSDSATWAGAFDWLITTCSNFKKVFGKG